MNQAPAVANGRPGEIDDAVAAVFRAEAGFLTASLVRACGDFALAEETVQDAILLALERWPEAGIPRRPGAWLATVARRLALNRLDRDARYREKLIQLGRLPPPEPDDRLRLIFTCCHPAIGRDAQVALTLRAVCGLTTAEIARALLASEAAVAQRIVRAQRKIVAAAIPYKLPASGELSRRLTEVLDVLYLMFNEGYLATGGEAASKRDLAEEATWLTTLVCRLLPAEPEPQGLLALMKLHLARADARFDSSGELVLLPAQDRSRWSSALIGEAVSLIEKAASRRRLGPFQVQAAIAACHAEADSVETTDWAQIVALYDLLLWLTPSPVVALHRAVAVGQVAGPRQALLDVDRLAPDLDGYHLFHAVRGQMLVDLGRFEQARAAQIRALELTRNRAERSLLRRRLFDDRGT